VEEKFKDWWEKGYGPSVIQAFLDSNYGISVSYDTIYRTADRLGLRED